MYVCYCLKKYITVMSCFCNALPPTLFPVNLGKHSSISGTGILCCSILVVSSCVFCHAGTCSYQLFWKQLKPPQTDWPLILEIALHFYWTLLDVFFFTEFYLASWPRHPKWKVPWMHRLGSSLRNDNSEAGWKPVTASPCTVYRQHETKVHVILQYLCETRCLHLL